MLFVTICKGKNSTDKQRIARRAAWNYPPGLKLLAEYWPQGNEVVAIMAVEANDVASIMAAVTDWDDLMDISVSPAVTAEEGLDLAASLMK